MRFAKYLVYVTWPHILLNISLFYNILVMAHAWLRVMREIHESDFVPDLFISRHSNHRCKWSIGASTVILDSAMHKRCPSRPVTSFSVNVTTPSDTFEAISSKFVRTRIPNSHVYGRRPISAHWANYNDVIGEQPYCSMYVFTLFFSPIVHWLLKCISQIEGILSCMVFSMKRLKSVGERRHPCC